MRLRHFTIDDFGEFRHAQMRDIDDGFVVIGGPQRAGKTTFMQAVRHLGFPIPRSDDLPPANDRYRLAAEFERDSHRYALSVEGHAKPKLASLDGASDRSVDDIFDGITQKQYEQLFTISLDELTRLPDGIGNAEELSAILLGAAYGDVTVIPEIQREFADRADEIGRSYGKPTKRSELRAPMDTIETGIELRDEARSQVEEYNETKRERDEVATRIEELEIEIGTLETKRERLSVVESEFETLRKFQRLRRSIDEPEVEQAEALPDNAVHRGAQLAEDYGAALEEMREARREFEQRTNSDDIDAYQALLLNRGDRLTSFEQQISGWRERANRIAEAESELEEQRSELQSRISELHCDWSGGFEAVKQVQTDKLSADRVEQAATTYEEAKSDLEANQSERRRQREKLEDIEDRLETLEEEHETSDVQTAVVRNLAISAGLAVVAGVGATAAGYVIAGLVAALVVLVIGILHASRTLETTEPATAPVREARAERNTVASEIESLNAAIENDENRIDHAASDIAEIREALGLPDEVSPDGVRTFYAGVVDLTAEIENLERAEERLDEEREELGDELRGVAALVSDVREFPWDDDEPLAQTRALFDAVESATTDLEYARKLGMKQSAVADVESEIETLLAEWDTVEPIDLTEETSEAIEGHLAAFVEAAEEAEEVQEAVEDRNRLASRLRDRFETASVRSAFDELRENDEDWIAVLERHAEDFVDVDAVKSRAEEHSSAIDQRKTKLEEKRETLVKLEQRMDELKSDDDVVAAREQITEGRTELRRLGEEYAVSRIAEQITDRLHQRFIEEVAGSLMDEASEIFRTITQDYGGIAHNDELDDLDFEALRDDRPSQGTDELSRATAEQLFLSVRLARIRQLDADLPVVFDDSMTNFDPKHGARTLRAIDELARTNQVFFLTCHPEQIRLARDHADISQYWCLEDCAFDGPHADGAPVRELLAAPRPSASRVRKSP